MNLVCILLAIAPLSFASFDIRPYPELARIISFFSRISKSYQWSCSAIASNLLNVPDDTKQCTRCLLFKLTTKEQKQDPVTVLESSEYAITSGFVENVVGCGWDPEKIICVFGNNSCNK